MVSEAPTTPNADALAPKGKGRWLHIPPMYPKQQAALFDPHRYSCIEATVKAGKTSGALAWILADAWNRGEIGRNWWWIAPVQSQANIAFERMKNMIRRVEKSAGDVEGGLATYKETSHTIHLRRGSTIWFKGSDKPDNLYGEDVYAAVLDEASRCREQGWFAVRSTLTATRGPVRMIGNVRGRKNWFYRMCRRAQAGDPDLGYHKITAYDAVDAGILDRAEIEDARRTLPPEVFAELYEAVPTEEGSNPFGMKAIRACVMEALAPGPAVSYGIDLAKTVDWTVVIGLDAAGHECVHDRWQSDWKQTRARILRDLPASEPANIDSTGVGDPICEDLQRERPRLEGKKFTSSPLSKQQWMEGLAAAVQQGKVGLTEETAREMEDFEFVYTRNGVRYSAPEGLHDDCVCAMALAVDCLPLRVTLPNVMATISTTPGEPGGRLAMAWESDELTRGLP
jgi:phage FluMu gp28-like protein